MTLRAFLFTLVANDPELNALGYNADNGFSSWAPDSPPGDLFWVLRWGVESEGVPGQRGRGRVTSRDATLWAYDRQTTYDTINAVLKRWQAMIGTLEAVRTGGDANDGAVLGTTWNGDTEDSYDDIYNALVRASSYTIIASGD